MLLKRLIALQKLKDGGMVMTFKTPLVYHSSKSFLKAKDSAGENSRVSFKSTMSYDEFNSEIIRIGNMFKNFKLNEELHPLCSLMSIMPDVNRSSDMMAEILSEITNLFAVAIPEEHWGIFKQTEADIIK